MAKPWKSAEERESYICDFVAQMVDSCERDTSLDRDRWSKNAQYFLGNPQWDATRLANEWMSRPHLAEYESLIRRIAAVMQDLIFEDPEFFDFTVDQDSSGSEELAKIFRKVVLYYLKDINFEKNSYLYCLIGGIYGVAISKLAVDAKLEWIPEVVVERIGKELERQKKAAHADGATVEVPEDESLDPMAQLEGEVLSTFGRIFDSRPERRQIKPRKRLRFSVDYRFPNPLNFFYDADCEDINRSVFHAERQFVRFFDIKHRFDSGAYSRAKIERVKATAPNTMSGMAGLNGSYEEQKLNFAGQLNSGTNPYTPVMEHIEYFGPLLDKDGDILEENCHFVVMNRKVLVKDTENTYYSQESPYYTAVFSPVPFKNVGAGAGDNARESNELIDDLFGNWMDLVKLAVYNPKVYDSTKLADQTQMEEFVRPGAMYDCAGAKSDEVFADIPVNLNVAPYLFQTVEALKLSGEKGAGVDVSSSNPASRARITASEVNSNLNRATQSVLSLGRELDANFIIPTVERLVDYVLQFGFQLDVLMDLKDSGVISETEFELVKGIPAIERFNELKRNYRVQIKGFRARLENQEFLKKINEAISVLSRIPPEAIQKIQWPELLKQYFRAFGFDTDRLLSQNTPQDKAREENALLGNEQMLMIGENDDDAQELMAHYELLLRQPSQAAAAHVMAHIQRLQQMGGQVPPPPPQVAAMLGLGGPEGEQQQVMQ